MSQLPMTAQPAAQQTLEAWYEKGRGAIAQVLNKAMPPDRFTRVVLSTLRRNPDLLACDSGSLWNSILTIAKWGLEPGNDSFAEAYIVPFGGEATPIASWKGMIRMVRRGAGRPDLPVYAHEVRQGDKFEVNLGFPKTIKHTPNITDPDRESKPVLFFYAVVAYSETNFDFEFMSKGQVDKIRQAAPSRNSPAWQNHYEEMGKKCAIRRLAKRLNLAPEEEELLGEIDRTEYGTETVQAPVGRSQLDAMKAEATAKAAAPRKQIDAAPQPSAPSTSSPSGPTQTSSAPVKSSTAPAQPKPASSASAGTEKAKSPSPKAPSPAPAPRKGPKPAPPPPPQEPEPEPVDEPREPGSDDDLPNDPTEPPPEPEQKEEEPPSRIEFVGEPLDFRTAPTHNKGLKKYVLHFMADDGEKYVFSYSREDAQVFENAIGNSKLKVIAEPFVGNGQIEWKVEDMRIVDDEK